MAMLPPLETRMSDAFRLTLGRWGDKYQAPSQNLVSPAARIEPQDSRLMSDYLRPLRAKCGIFQIIEIRGAYVSIGFRFGKRDLTHNRALLHVSECRRADSDAGNDSGVTAGRGAAAAQQPGARPGSREQADEYEGQARRVRIAGRKPGPQGSGSA